ncbi:MAG: DNA integrity scanning protein DisA nucleotide-binding domain protein [Thermoguttaceae bacterium]|nr:DNA integrity scanning protein DisA nucleotide-binding domain protein [Thermoguttaceae bacterium]
MSQKETEEKTLNLFERALAIRRAMGGACLLVVAKEPLDWARLREAAKDAVVIIAARDDDSAADSFLRGARTHGFPTVRLDGELLTSYEQIQYALFTVSAAGLIRPSDRAVVLYAGFHPTLFDSIGILSLGSPLDQLTPEGLRKITERIPYRTFRRALDLAIEIGREGREGKTVGTLLIVGDTRRVLRLSTPAGYDPVKGYTSKERNINDAKTREGLKEIAPLDGAFVISRNGEVKAACRMVDTDMGKDPQASLFRSCLGAAAVSKATKAAAIAVPRSTGTIHLFLDGEQMFQIEPRERGRVGADPAALR